MDLVDPDGKPLPVVDLAAMSVTTTIKSTSSAMV